VRNRCAHTEVIWNFTNKISVASSKEKDLKVANTIAIIYQFMRVIDRKGKWLNEVYCLIDKTVKATNDHIEVIKNQAHIYEIMGFKSWPNDIKSFEIMLKQLYQQV
jgi:uncharacterized protein YtpQ (UPF0354 family)